MKRKKSIKNNNFTNYYDTICLVFINYFFWAFPSPAKLERAGSPPDYPSVGLHCCAALKHLHQCRLMASFHFSHHLPSRLTLETSRNGGLYSMPMIVSDANPT